MELKLFKNDRHYRKIQRKWDCRKSDRPSVCDEEVQVIVDYWTKRSGLSDDARLKYVVNVLCHGVRDGLELDLFAKHLPGAEVLGTDLFKRKHERVRRWDFHVEDPDWMGKFDLVYSNSFDHVRDPFFCAKVWLNQLKSDGLLFVHWGWHHADVSGADCFGAGLHEYAGIFDRFGVVKDIIWLGSDVVPGGPMAIVVAGRKE